MFKDRLKAIREQNKLTQRKMANLLNMTVTGYAGWEQGKAQPNIEIILKLCEILNTNPNELLDFNTDYQFEYSHNGTHLIHKEKNHYEK
jgi:Predicted transcriptional regulators